MVKRVDKWLLVASLTVFAVAFTMRVLPPWIDGALHYRVHNDDGVYYGASVALWHGVLPYSDYVFLHPPGIIVLLSPFVALGSIFGDSNGLFLARESWAAMGSLNAVLVTILIWKHGRTAAVFAGLLYATWGVAARPEVTLHLVTALNVLFLLAVLTLKKWPHRPLTAGLLIGFACAIKIWAGIFVIVLVPYVWVRHGRAAALRFLGGAAAIGAVVCLPFAISDPSRAWHLVVTEQLERSGGGLGLVDRVTSFVGGLGPLDDRAPAFTFVAVMVAVIMAPLAYAVVRRLRPREWGDPVWLSILVALQLAMLLIGPVFYGHYAAFVAPGVALALGALMVRLERLDWRAVALATPLLAVPAAMTLNAGFGVIQHDQLVAATAGHKCVFNLSATVLVEGDLLSRNINNDCSFDIDSFGTRLTMDDGSDEAWQRRVQGQIAKSDMVIMAGGEFNELDETTRAYLREHFHDVAKVNPGNLVIRDRR